MPAAHSRRSGRKKEIEAALSYIKKRTEALAGKLLSRHDYPPAYIALTRRGSKILPAYYSVAASLAVEEAKRRWPIVSELEFIEAPRVSPQSDPSMDLYYGYLYWGFHVIHPRLGHLDYVEFGIDRDDYASKVDNLLEEEYEMINVITRILEGKPDRLLRACERAAARALRVLAGRLSEAYVLATIGGGFEEAARYLKEIPPGEIEAAAPRLPPFEGVHGPVTISILEPERLAREVHPLLAPDKARPRITIKYITDDAIVFELIYPALIEYPKGRVGGTVKYVIYIRSNGLVRSNLFVDPCCPESVAIGFAKLRLDDL